MNRIRFLLIILILPFAILSGQKSEFIIVSEPGKLVIYNRYEQTLNENSKKKFGENVPFMVVNSESFLSDGLTPVIETAYLNDKYYLLRDEKGNPSVNGKVTVKKTGPVTAYNKPGVIRNDCKGETVSGKKISIRKGSKVKASFISGDEIYTGVISGSDLLFLYIRKKDFNEENRETAAEKKKTSFSSDHTDKLKQLTDKYNAIFSSVYKFAGEEFKAAENSPFITMVFSPDEIKVKIKNYNRSHQGSLTEFYSAAENIINDCDYKKAGNIENISFRIRK